MVEDKVDRKKIQEYQQIFSGIKKEISKIVVGQQEVANLLILGLLCKSHMLVEGIPGIAKTLLIRALAATTGCKFNRIQFTVDLLPTDITGITTYNPQQGFSFIKGPIFANFVLADEINRAPAKVQSALLEAMAEHQTTIGRETFPMMDPFFVMATMNPIESSGSLKIDQPVFINGQLKTGTELLKQIKDPIMSDGTIKMYNINDSWTLSLNENGKLEKRNCYLYTLPYNDEIVTIQTSVGRKIKVTKNHPFLVNENGIVKWKKAENLTLNDHLVSSKELPEFKETKKEAKSHKETLRILEKTYKVVYHEEILSLKEKSNNFMNFSSFTGLDFDKLRIASSLKIKELSNLINIKNKSDYWKLIRFLRRSTKNNETKSLLSKYFHKFNFNLNKETDYIESSTITRINRFNVDKDIIFWLAFLLSDGSINKNYIAAYQKNYPEALDEFKQITENKIGLRISGIRENSKGKEIKVSSKPVVDYLNLRFNLREEEGHSRTPTWFISFPQYLRRIFIKTFISLESNLDDKENRISFSQKDEETINTISYMLLQEGFISFLGKRRNKEIYTLRLRVADTLKYLNNIGWFKTEKIDKLLKNSSKTHNSLSIPINRNIVLRITKLLGLNSFHTFKNRKNILSRKWYCSYKSIKEGKNRISTKSLKLMTSDIRKEIEFRKNLDMSGFVKTNPRHAAVLCGLPMTEIINNTNFTRHNIWKLYSEGQCLQQQQIHSYIETQFKERIIEAEQLLTYLEGLLKPSLFYDKIKKITYEDYKGLAFGLTVPELKNYIAGFGACGINHNTYPLPEAQKDRFLFKLFMGYPEKDDEQKILKTNISLRKFEDYNIRPIVSPEKIIEMQEFTKTIYLSPDIEKYIVEIVNATRTPKEYGIGLGKYVEWGGSPRASIGLFIASKANALLQGSPFVTPSHVKQVAFPILRHRILLNYEGMADEIKTDQIINEILSKVPVP